MGSVTEPSTELAWKLNSGCWNPLATTAVVPFVMLIRTILIPNLDCFDGERNALYDLCNFITYTRHDFTLITEVETRNAHDV